MAVSGFRRWVAAIALLVAWVATPVAPTRAAALTLTPFKSTLYPYSIDYPRTWKHTIFPIGQIKVDGFYAPPAPGTGLTDNVNIFSQPLPSTLSDAELLRLNEQQIRSQLKISAHRIGTIKVGHRKVALIAYNIPYGGRTISTTQALASIGKRAWYFTLSTLPGRAAGLRPVFAAMLRTFHAR